MIQTVLGERQGKKAGCRKRIRDVLTNEKRSTVQKNGSGGTRRAGEGVENIRDDSIEGWEKVQKAFETTQREGKSVENIKDNLMDGRVCSRMVQRVCEGWDGMESIRDNLKGGKGCREYKR